jgi:bifunctional lysine-specific demethylase and histidyl-hydroxylase NO66
MNALDCLAALLAPLDTAAFLERCYEKEPVHLRTPEQRWAASPLLTQDELLAALARRAELPEGLIAFPEHAGAPDAGALLGDADRLGAYLAAGHPLVWNRARGISPTVDAVTAALAEALGAHVWPNVYATGVAGTPLDMHFDSHEVLAVHCEGHKEWTISEVRVDRPLDAVEMEPAVRAALRSRRDEAVARPKLRFTVDPGDVVYVPRGQFHNARTLAGRALHVTFGIRQLTGFDVVEQLAKNALADPLFREFLPPVAADPAGARASAQLSILAARLAEMFSEERLQCEVAAARRQLVHHSQPGGLGQGPDRDPGV